MASKKLLPSSRRVVQLAEARLAKLCEVDAPETEEDRRLRTEGHLLIHMRGLHIIIEQMK
jgi:hypothetical protein